MGLFFALINSQHQKTAHGLSIYVIAGSGQKIATGAVDFVFLGLESAGQRVFDRNRK